MSKNITRNLYLITSAINSQRSAIPTETRFEDTLSTIASVHLHDPTAVVVMFESSPTKLSVPKVDLLKKCVEHFVMLSDVPEVNLLGRVFQQSAAESLSIKLTLEYIKQQNWDIPIKRIFKLTGRGYLTHDFHASYYDNASLNSKYVFKKRVTSWMSSDLSLLDTRCFSFSYDLLDNAIELMEATKNGCLASGRDMEHIIFDNIDKTKLVEKDLLGYNCRVSLNGELKCD